MKLILRNIAGTVKNELDIGDGSDIIETMIDRIRDVMAIQSDRFVKFVYMGKELDIKRSFVDNQVKDGSLVIVCETGTITSTTATTATAATAATQATQPTTMPSPQHIQQPLAPLPLNIWANPPRPEDGTASGNNLYNVEQIHGTVILTTLAILTDPRLADTIQSDSRTNLAEILAGENYRDLIRSNLSTVDSFVNSLRHRSNMVVTMTTTTTTTQMTTTHPNMPPSLSILMNIITELMPNATGTTQDRSQWLAYLMQMQQNTTPPPFEILTNASANANANANINVNDRNDDATDDDDDDDDDDFEDYECSDCARQAQCSNYDCGILCQKCAAEMMCECDFNDNEDNSDEICNCGCNDDTDSVQSAPAPAPKQTGRKKKAKDDDVVATKQSPPKRATKKKQTTAAAVSTATVSTATVSTATVSTATVSTEESKPPKDSKPTKPTEEPTEDPKPKPKPKRVSRKKAPPVEDEDLPAPPIKDEEPPAPAKRGRGRPPNKK